MMRLATVVEVTPRVRVRASGGEIVLRASATLGSLLVGDRVLVTEADNGGWYAIERIGA